MDDLDDGLRIFMIFARFREWDDRHHGMARLALFGDGSGQVLEEDGTVLTEFADYDAAMDAIAGLSLEAEQLSQVAPQRDDQ